MAVHLHASLVLLNVNAGLTSKIYTALQKKSTKICCDHNITVAKSVANNVITTANYVLTTAMTPAKSVACYAVTAIKDLECLRIMLIE